MSSLRPKNEIRVLVRRTSSARFSALDQVSMVRNLGLVSPNTRIAAGGWANIGVQHLFPRQSDIAAQLS